MHLADIAFNQSLYNHTSVTWNNDFAFWYSWSETPLRPAVISLNNASPPFSIVFISEAFKGEEKAFFSSAANSSIALTSSADNSSVVYGSPPDASVPSLANTPISCFYAAGTLFISAVSALAAAFTAAAGLGPGSGAYIF